MCYNKNIISLTMSIDSQLLNRERISREEEARVGQRLRRRKQEDQPEEQSGLAKEDAFGEGQETLRQKLLRYRRAKKNNRKGNLLKKEKNEEKNLVGYPSRRGSKLALKYSWLSLIFSGGLTAVFSLTYLNFHFFGRVVLPSFFCKFGDEWTPEFMKGMNDMSKSARRALGLVEILALILVNIILAFVVIVVIYMFTAAAMIVWELLGWFINFFVG